MTTFTYAQLEGLWIQAGGSKATAPIAAAIAEAESGGNSNVTSGNPDGGTNVGLWQLDTPGGKGAGHSVQQLKDPLTNARVAVGGSSNGTDWSAWSTFVSGAYKRFLNSKTTPANSGVSGGAGGQPAAGTSVGNATVNCLIGVPNPVTGFASFLPWVDPTTICLLSKPNARALVGGILMTGGFIFGFVGVGVLVAGAFSQTKAGQAVGKAVGPAAELAGAGIALAGAPEVGAGVAAAGHGLKSSAKHAQERRQTKATAASKAEQAAKREATADRKFDRDEEMHAARLTKTKEQTTSIRSARRRANAAARSRTSGGYKSGPSEAEVRAQLRKRADQVSTKVPA